MDWGKLHYFYVKNQIMSFGLLHWDHSVYNIVKHKLRYKLSIEMMFNENPSKYKEYYNNKCIFFLGKFLSSCGDSRVSWF